MRFFFMVPPRFREPIKTIAEIHFHVHDPMFNIRYPPSTTTIVRISYMLAQIPAVIGKPSPKRLQSRRLSINYEQLWDFEPRAATTSSRAEYMEEVHEETDIK